MWEGLAAASVGGLGDVATEGHGVRRAPPHCGPWLLRGLRAPVLVLPGPLVPWGGGSGPGLGAAAGGVLSSALAWAVPGFDPLSLGRSPGWHQAGRPEHVLWPRGASRLGAAGEPAGSVRLRRPLVAILLGAQAPRLQAHVALVSSHVLGRSGQASAHAAPPHSPCLSSASRPGPCLQVGFEFINFVSCGSLSAF